MKVVPFRIGFSGPVGAPIMSGTFEEKISLARAANFLVRGFLNNKALLSVVCDIFQMVGDMAGL
jgi:hypothetical protein